VGRSLLRRKKEFSELEGGNGVGSRPDEGSTKDHTKGSGETSKLFQSRRFFCGRSTRQKGKGPEAGDNPVSGGIASPRGDVETKTKKRGKKLWGNLFLNCPEAQHLRGGDGEGGGGGGGGGPRRRKGGHPSPRSYGW